jgi:hypothetical protein
LICGNYGTAEAVPFQSKFKVTHYHGVSMLGRVPANGYN